MSTKIPTSIYIHIPFCVKKCPYCDFNSYGVGNNEPDLAGPYTEAVCKELEYYLSNYWDNRTLFSVFFGGGTPSLLTASNLNLILGIIRKFTDLNPQTEVTIEANPGTVQEELGLEKLRHLRGSGFNRISFGSQSFSMRKLEFLGRLHSTEDIISAVENARIAGFKRLNLDLIFGTKGETLIEYTEDLSKTLLLFPEHISAYGLTIEPGTEFGKLQKKGLKLTGTEEVQTELFEKTQSALVQQGYIQYEVSNYSREGEECRHNLHYWKRGEYFGIGAGAHGFLTDHSSSWGRRWFNIPKPEHYIKKVNDSSFSLQTDEILTKEQAETEFISLALRTREGIIANRYSEVFSDRFEDKYEKGISWSQKNGLVAVGDSFVRVTTKGMLFVNTVVEKMLR